MRSFDEIFEDKTKYGTKIKTSEYKEIGKYAIIDQGQEEIAGYTDLEKGVFEDVPAIIFGDHTRVIKYVRDPFFLGADGVKILKCKELNVNYKYLYYALKNAKIPNTGYNRHFKWLKQIQIEYPSIDKQEKIVKILDKVVMVIEDRRKEIQELDKLIKARFVEMFGDPVNNEKGFVKAPMGDYMTVLTDFSSNGSYKTLDNGVIMYDELNYAWMVRTTDLESGDMASIKYIDESAYELLSKSKIFGGEIIMNKIGSAGKIYLMPQTDMPASLGRNAFMFRYDERINVKFLYYLLTSDYGQNEIQQYVRGAVTKTITKSDARSVRIIVPPIELQNEFEAFAHQVNKSKVAVQKALDEAQLLFDSLMQEYFG